MYDDYPRKCNPDLGNPTIVKSNQYSDFPIIMCEVIRQLGVTGVLIELLNPFSTATLSERLLKIKTSIDERITQRNIVSGDEYVIKETFFIALATEVALAFISDDSLRGEMHTEFDKFNIKMTRDEHWSYELMLLCDLLLRTTNVTKELVYGKKLNDSECIMRVDTYNKLLAFYTKFGDIYFTLDKSNEFRLHVRAFCNTTFKFSDICGNGDYASKLMIQLRAALIEL